MAIRITCINKDNGYHQNPNLAITHLGWIGEDGKSNKSTRLEIYDWIKNQNGIAYVTDYFGNKVNVFTAETINGTKYLKTAADNTTTNNLLSLPECK
ncbi:hypothetical protein AR438_04845 [Chryseobacterium aquaticum]|uniref:DUF3892 domain-containing protein n=1 Tax=Chryseobacterium aquaticum TaxID=452084 RepID=A0A0Q3HVE9_9FLAO|nr:DUF3892 domain-containing protein [Chryseobacterium aquaticum]KQK26581.1 hypothetical protein AR438_04845 [Chryseobacterium aquaticum]